MELIEAEDLAEFENILRKQRWAYEEFSLQATDTTDPKTDEVLALQVELVVRCESTGRSRQYEVPSVFRLPTGDSYAACCC